MKKIIAVLMALVLVVGCFAACGKNDTTKDDGTNKPAAQDDATTPAENGTIIVGYTIYEPMNYLDENGNLVGFDTELAKAVFSNLGYKVVFKEIKWENKYTELNSGAINCIWNGFTCNTSDDDGVLRSDKVDFSYNYMKNKQVIVAKTDSGITSASDLKGKIADAEIGSAGESYAKDTFPGIIFKGATKQTDCLLSVATGKAHFAVLDEQLAKSYCGKGDYSNLTIIEALSSEVEFYAIGFKKGSDLTAKVNAELVKLAADGTIAALAEKYGVSNTAITDFSDQQ